MTKVSPKVIKIFKLYNYTCVADNARFGEQNVTVNKCFKNGQQTIYRFLLIVVVNK